MLGQQYLFANHHPTRRSVISVRTCSALESSATPHVPVEEDQPFDILLAEDNLVNQKLAVKVLEKYGHKVEIAENGIIACDMFKARAQHNMTSSS